MIEQICMRRIEAKGWTVTLQPGLTGGIVSIANRGQEWQKAAGDDSDKTLVELYGVIFGWDVPLPERERISRVCPLLDGSLDQGRLF